jgi:hypothetical protein
VNRIWRRVIMFVLLIAALAIVLNVLGGVLIARRGLCAARSLIFSPISATGKPPSGGLFVWWFQR